MNKITTYLKFTEKSQLDNLKLEEEQLSMNPTEETVNKILQYAATYRAEVLSTNEYIEYCLN